MEPYNLPTNSSILPILLIAHRHVCVVSDGSVVTAVNPCSIQKLPTDVRRSEQVEIIRADYGNSVPSLVNADNPLPTWWWLVFTLVRVRNGDPN
ncbi:hypothetical protein TTRE_0000854801 [Trichuris trichiura]|uniref:Uncharacterized protein n=1 Tax=Trichuris trichiura TaxID=36087 RepID=A0A077ZKJ1_TRITR|nr:hypothetical protein TTRE_0000854801 [Trichuris trichiura]